MLFYLLEKLIVNYRRIHEKAVQLKKDFSITDEFKVSNNWVYRFCRWHNIGSKAITHCGQVCKIFLSHKTALVNSVLAVALSPEK